LAAFLTIRVSRRTSRPRPRSPGTCSAQPASTQASSRARSSGYCSLARRPIPRRWTSRTADEHNFQTSTPTQDDDAITFTLAARKVSAVRHIVDVDPLLLLTSGGEWVLAGDQSGTLRPTDINAKQFSQHGASRCRRSCSIRPCSTSRRGKHRARAPAGGDRYVGADLTLFASHLFAGHTLRDWAYQETPNPTVWCVRSDGVLLGLTILDEQKVLAWHRHDTDGTVEQVCVIPEGGEDRLYLVVVRNGVRMLERMASRVFGDT
jgi:hypothetical protein